MSSTPAAGTAHADLRTSPSALPQTARHNPRADLASVAVTTFSRKSRPTTGSTRYRMVVRISCNQFAPRFTRRPLLIRSIAFAHHPLVGRDRPGGYSLQDVGRRVRQPRIDPAVIGVGPRSAGSMAIRIGTHLFHTANPGTVFEHRDDHGAFVRVVLQRDPRRPHVRGRIQGDRDALPAPGVRVTNDVLGQVTSQLVQVGGAVIPSAVDHASVLGATERVDRAVTALPRSAVGAGLGLLGQCTIGSKGRAGRPWRGRR